MSYGYLITSGDAKFWRKLHAADLPSLKGIPARCPDCGTSEKLTIDHKPPKSTNPKARGLLANYRLMCAPCNEARGNKKLESP